MSIEAGTAHCARVCDECGAVDALSFVADGIRTATSNVILDNANKTTKISDIFEDEDESSSDADDESGSGSEGSDDESGDDDEEEEEGANSSDDDFIASEDDDDDGDASFGSSSEQSSEDESKSSTSDNGDDTPKRKRARHSGGRTPKRARVQHTDESESESESDDGEELVCDEELSSLSDSEDDSSSSSDDAPAPSRPRRSTRPRINYAGMDDVELSEAEESNGASGDESDEDGSATDASDVDFRHRWYARAVDAPQFERARCDGLGAYVPHRASAASDDALRRLHFGCVGALKASYFRLPKLLDVTAAVDGWCGFRVRPVTSQGHTNMQSVAYQTALRHVRCDDPDSFVDLGDFVLMYVARVCVAARFDLFVASSRNTTSSIGGVKPHALNLVLSSEYHESGACDGAFIRDPRHMLFSTMRAISVEFSGDMRRAVQGRLFANMIAFVYHTACSASDVDYDSLEVLMNAEAIYAITTDADFPRGLRRRRECAILIDPPGGSNVFDNPAVAGMTSTQRAAIFRRSVDAARAHGASVILCKALIATITAGPGLRKSHIIAVIGAALLYTTYQARIAGLHVDALNDELADARMDQWTSEVARAAAASIIPLCLPRVN